MKSHLLADSRRKPDRHLTRAPTCEVLFTSTVLTRRYHAFRTVASIFAKCKVLPHHTKAMLSPCLLLSLLSYSSARHPGDVPQSPTCEQLREFWDEINQMTQTAERTNEIPVLPLKPQNTRGPVLMAASLKNGRSYKKVLKDKPPYFMDVANPYYRYSAPQQPASLPTNSILSKQAPLNEELNGVFGEFQEQAADEIDIGSAKQHQAMKPSNRRPARPDILKLESSGVPSGNKKKDEVEYFIPQWGLPEEADTFGGFVDFDFTSPYLPMTRTPKGIKKQWSAITREEFSQTCDALLNSDCKIKEECLCKGERKLTCTNGKCLNLGNQEENGAKYGTWHDGPIPHSQLHLSARHQKRSYRSIFM